jgi:hypothetical protein
LTPRTVSLEQAFMDLTRDAVDYPTNHDVQDRSAA